MIEHMKKITLLVPEKERTEFVFALKKEGAVHVKHAVQPVSHEIAFAEERIGKIEKVIALLRPFAGKVSGEMELPCEAKAIMDAAEDVERANAEREECLSAIREIERKMKWFDVWGRVDPEDIKRTEEKGLKVALYKLTTSEFKKIPREKKLYKIKSGEGHVYAADLNFNENGELPYEKVKIPECSFEKMEQEVAFLRKKEARIEAALGEAASCMDVLEEYEKKLAKEKEFLSVKWGMKEEEKFSYLTGFCPERKVKRIIELCRRTKLGYLIEEADIPEETPTLITNPAWISIIDPVFKFMNTLPGYGEFDISAYFLIFFSLFFAMLIGDAGYGIIFLAATFFIRRKFKKLPREPFFLMYLLSAGTIAWGTVTGTWFGSEKIAKLPFFSAAVIEKISSFNSGNQNLMIFICFVIGVLHLTIAHVVKGIRVMNSIRVLAEAGWIMILWGMFFAAGTFVIGNAFPSQAPALLLVGSVLVLFCSNPGKNMLKGALDTLTELPLSIISAFSDIVSYLRLFAVGYASVIVAKSFNDMALAGGMNGFLGGASAALILFFGHMLNIVLGGMAVVVHGIRLNMLEFSGHLGMQWSGKKYEPFEENETQQTRIGG
jgi:V/A-type H+-transporting ATPase subunit I